MFLFFRKACLLVKRRKTFLHDLFARFMTLEYRGLERVTGGYKGLQKVTRSYNRLQEVTGVTRGDRG